MSNTASRLLRLILLLQEQPNQKAETLAEKLEVSIRTLHRYMGMLDEMGIPVYSERGPYGGFSLVRGYKMPPLIFTPQEAVALALGTRTADQLWGGLYHGASLSALSKLEHVLPEEQLREIRWAEQKLISSNLHRRPINDLEPDLIVIRQALKENRKLEIEYQAAMADGISRRTVQPYHLLHRAGLWYLIAFCELRQDMRAFRLDRMQRVNLRPDAFQAAADFDLQQFLDTGFLFEKRHMVRMRFDARYAGLARSYPMSWESLADDADGSVIVEFAATDPMMAAGMALSYGPGVEVLEPEELIEIVKEWATAVVSRYSTK